MAKGGKKRRLGASLPGFPPFARGLGEVAADFGLSRDAQEQFCRGGEGVLWGGSCYGTGSEGRDVPQLGTDGAVGSDGVPDFRPPPGGNLGQHLQVLA